MVSICDSDNITTNRSLELVAILAPASQFVVKTTNSVSISCYVQVLVLIPHASDGVVAIGCTPINVSL